jgi:uncharacterized protein YcaQ
MAPEIVSAAQARRIALAAQGFGRPRPASVGTRQLNGLLDRLKLLQIDSVNVFERSHYLPVFARLGSYDKALLDKLTFTKRGPYLEYWAHVAALIPVETWPLMRWRMEFYREKYLGDPDSWASTNRSMLDWLRAELADRGPLAASEIEHDSNKRSGPWWGWSDVKQGLEYLFFFGEVATAGRTRFERRYGLAEQIVPAETLAREVPKGDAIRELVRRSAQAHGIGTVGDLGDYYRINKGPTLTAIRELVDEGELLPVGVRGWERDGKTPLAWLHKDAKIPRRVEASALLSPFDPIVWERERALRLFDFHYRIEIYTPQPKRVFGYYVLPVLLDDEIVGRVDLKSDRQARVLRVQAAWTENKAPNDTAERVAGLLCETARWQGLDSVEVVDRGTLAPALAAAVAAIQGTSAVA